MTGVCRAVGAEGCTLRAAIEEANASAIDRIELASGVEHRLDAAATVDAVASPLTISAVGAAGAQVEVAAGGIRVAAGSLVLSDVAISGDGPTGIVVADGATLLARDLEVSGSFVDGVQVAGVMLAAGSTVRGALDRGVAVSGSGMAAFGESSIDQNAAAGLDVAAGGEALLRNTTVTRSGAAVTVAAGGSLDLVFSTLGDVDVAVSGGGTVSSTASIVVPSCDAPLSSSEWSGLGSGCGLGSTDVAATGDAIAPVGDG